MGSAMLPFERAMVGGGFGSPLWQFCTIYIRRQRPRVTGNVCVIQSSTVRDSPWVDLCRPNVQASQAKLNWFRNCVTNVWATARGLPVLSLFGVCKIFFEYSTSIIKLKLYWGRVGSSYSSTRNSPNDSRLRSSDFKLNQHSPCRVLTVDSCARWTFFIHELKQWATAPVNRHKVGAHWLFKK